MSAIRAEIRRVTAASTPFNCRVRVASMVRLSANFLRVAVEGPELQAYRGPLPADAFKLLLPPDGTGRVDFPERGPDGLPYWPQGTRQPVLRAFTVRRFDPADGPRIEFDALLHPGLVATWLEHAQVGDLIGLSGMRREFVAGEGVTEHLLVGDASALPAIAAIVESLAPQVPASVYLAVQDEADAALLPRRDHVDVRCLTGDGHPTGSGSALETAVRGHPAPRGRGQVWLGAEASVVRGLRRFVLDELGVARADLHAAGYWKSGSDSTAVDAVHLGRYQQELAAGADVTDPDVRERVEFQA